MKNLVAFLMMSVMVTATFAQQTPKPDYKIDGNLIHATLFHDNGKIAQEGYYTKKGELQGAWVSYDVNGNVTAEGNYKQGQKVGTWTFYQGNVQKEVTYTNSKIASVKTWEVTDTRVVSNE